MLMLDIIKRTPGRCFLRFKLLLSRIEKHFPMPQANWHRRLSLTSKKATLYQIHILSIIYWIFPPDTLASSNASLSADQFCSSPSSYSLGFFIWHHHHPHPAEATSPITPGQKQGKFPFIINLGQLYPHACSTSVPQKTHILDSGHWK